MKEEKGRKGKHRHNVRCDNERKRECVCVATGRQTEGEKVSV